MDKGADAALQRLGADGYHIRCPLAAAAVPAAGGYGLLRINIK